MPCCTYDKISVHNNGIGRREHKKGRQKPRVEGLRLGVGGASKKISVIIAVVVSIVVAIIRSKVLLSRGRVTEVAKLLVVKAIVTIVVCHGCLRQSVSQRGGQAVCERSCECVCERAGECAQQVSREQFVQGGGDDVQQCFGHRLNERLAQLL